MNLLERPEYNFLKTDPCLGKNIIFLTYGGSHAYGTNVEGSDIDIRGCTLNSKADLLVWVNLSRWWIQRRIPRCTPSTSCSRC